MHKPRTWRAVLSYGLGALLVLQGLGIVMPSKTHAASPVLKITEIHWGGAASDTNDQWLELENVDASTITFTDATAYTITIPSLSETVVLDGTYGTLAPGQFLVITKEALATSDVRALVGVNYHQLATLSLPTTPAEYHVFDDTALEIDTIADAGSGLPFAGKAPATGVVAASMARKDVMALGTDPTNWYTAATIGAGFDGGTVQYGTPGDTNVELATPTGAITPGKSTTLAVPPTVSGTATGASKVDIRFTKVSSGSAFQQDYVALVDGSGNYTMTATAPALIAARYAVDIFATDVSGNMSQPARLDNAPSSGDFNYEVLADAVTVVPAPMLTTPPALTNQSPVTLTGTLDVSSTTYDSLEVLRDGSYYATFPVSGSSFSFPVILKLNASNFIQVVAVRAGDGVFSLDASATIVNDSIAPNPVDLTKVTLNANQPGTDDSFLGQPGAAEAGTTLFVYGDSAQTKLLATLTVATDGSFSQVDIGDNTHSAVFLVLQDAAGNRSTMAKLDNPTGFSGTGNLAPSISNIQQTEATVSWMAVPAASKYRIKYKQAGGMYGSVTEVCLTGNANCPLSTTIHGLFSDTDYVIAIAAVDKYGNESPYEEAVFHTQATPVVIEPVAAPVVEAPVVTHATDKVAVVTTPAPTPTPSPTPSDTGEVKSADTVASKNWTPWIVLGALVAIAVLATAGYFYWFGGEAGEAALASVLAERAKRQEEDAEAEKLSKASKPKKTDGKDRRW